MKRIKVKELADITQGWIYNSESPIIKGWERKDEIDQITRCEVAPP